MITDVVGEEMVRMCGGIDYPCRIHHFSLLQFLMLFLNEAMLGYLERLSLQSGASKVFVLSTQTMEWFVERGFKEVPVEVRN